MKKFLSYFQSLGMITQMNILMCCLFGLTIVIFISLQLSIVNSVTSTFMSASDSLMKKSNNIGISNRLQKIVRVTHELLNLNTQRVQSINLLYNKSFDNIGINYTNQALIGGNSTPSYYDYEYLQYYPFGGDIGTDFYNRHFINFTGVLNTLMLAFDQTNMFIQNTMIVFHNSSAELYCKLPTPSPPIQVYHPLQRPWYTQFVAYRQESGLDLWMSPVFRKFDPPTFTVVISNSLLHQGFQGLTHRSLNFSQLQNLISVTSDSVILVYDDGTILFQNAFIDYTLLNETTYIFNESLTGFSMAQWNKFKQISLRSKYENIIITWNSIFKQPMTLNIHKFTNLPFYLIIFSNMEDFCEATKLSTSIVDQLHLSQSIQMIMIFSLDIALLVIVSVIFMFILHPVKHIQWLVYNSHKLNQSNTMFLTRKSDNQLLKLQFNLIKLIMRMRQSTMLKSDICKQFESFKFPKQGSLENTIRINMLSNPQRAYIKQYSLRNLMKHEECNTQVFSIHKHESIKTQSNDDDYNLNNSFSLGQSDVE